MAIKRRVLMTGVFPAIAIALPSIAREHHEHAGGECRYAMRVAGLPIARFTFRFAADAYRLQSHVRFESDGLATLTSGAWSIFDATHDIGNDGSVIPQIFEAYHYKRDRVREVRIEYGREGEIETISYRQHGREREPEVPKDLWEGTVDPLTAIHRLRGWQEKGSGRIPSNVPILDGRKRYDLHLREVEGQPRKLELMIVGIFGFDPDDPLISFPPTGTQHWLTLDLTKQPPVVPDRIASPHPSGPVIELID